MGRDGQPKARQAAQLARKLGNRAEHKRILIVSEGSKTEPNYFKEIRKKYRLHNTNMQVQHSRYGTSPLQVVEYAEHLFLNGDDLLGIQPRAFEEVYAVLDRDSHLNYQNALSKALSLNGTLRNDNKQLISFESVASVPCFELWLLLHFVDVLFSINRNDAYRELRRYLPSYNKGAFDAYSQTCAYLEDAISRAEHLETLTNAFNGVDPYTDIHKLVKKLISLKK